jgi:hypothetical protein
MWRTRAIITLLVEDIAGLTMPRAALDDSKDISEPPEIEPLKRAGRRSRLVVAVDGLALAVLFLLRDSSRPFLPWGPTVETVFTLGALAVAAHAGFRWAQLERYRAVFRACSELRERSAP